jgi:hypothetical protein
MPQKSGRNDNPIDRVHGQVDSTGCKVQSETVKEVALNRSWDTHATIRLAAV